MKQPLKNISRWQTRPERRVHWSSSDCVCACACINVCFTIAWSIGKKIDILRWPLLAAYRFDRYWVTLTDCIRSAGILIIFYTNQRRSLIVFHEGMDEFVMGWKEKGVGGRGGRLTYNVAPHGLGLWKKLVIDQLLQDWTPLLVPIGLP